jgi:exodeoxyribonuclease VII small subunit
MDNILNSQNDNFENKINQAKKILDKLIDPKITLEDSVNIFKEGMLELDKAQKLLDDAKLEYSEYSK